MPPWSETYNNGSYSAIVVSGGGGAATNLWSDPATWGGSVPLATDVVTIASTHVVYLDIPNAVCASLDIQGSLIAVQTASVGLTTGNINVGAAGVFQVGTVAAPYPAAYTATFTFNGAEVGRATRTVSGTNLGFTNNGVGRSLQVQPGGTLTMIGGNTPTFKRSKLNANAAAGTNTFTTMDAVDWLAGDDIVMGTTDFFGVSVPEKLALQANASGTSIQTTATIASARWGALQYVTDTGMSLTAGTLTGAPAGVGTASATPTVLDERAMLINLRRNIIVQGVNDTAWTSNKFGVHIMAMSGGSSPGAFVQPNMKLDGVRVIRCGQAGVIGRYPIHWHMCSFDMAGNYTIPSVSGTFLGALTGNYAKNCAIEQSGQRMITIHGTNGVTLDGNVGFDITGHAIFLEDGSEQDNVITNNVVMKVRSPTSTNKLLNHDIPAAASLLGINVPQGSSGVWFTNPKNTLTGNWVNDSQGNGIWNSFAPQCFGLSINVVLNPRTTTIQSWSDNWVVGNAGVGAETNDEVQNDKGDIAQSGYQASFFGNPIKNLRTFKNSGGGYNNRINEGQYQNFTAADNAGMDVFGQATVNTSIMVNTLSIAESLNNVNSKRLSSYRAAFATYHELLNFKNCMMVGYTYIAGAQGDSTQTFTGGGIFRMWDLYLQPIFSFSENTGNKLIGCDAPFRTLPPFKDGAADANRHWALAGAIYDKTGIFGNQGKYWVYNDTFFTYGATSPVNITSGVPSNGIVTTDHYSGITQFRHTDDLSAYQFQLPISVSRQDTGGTEVGNWNIPDGVTSSQLGWMRSFAAHQGGRFVVSCPGHTPGNYFEFISQFQKSSGDSFLIAVPFGGSYTPKVYQQANGAPRLGDGRADVSTGATSSAVASGYGQYLTATGSFANVVADTTGLIYWQDTANNLLWMQVKVYPLVAAATTAGIWGSDPFVLEYKSVVVAVTV